jgi:hypothetical protein
MTDQDPEGLFQGLGKDDSNLKASEELKSRVIASYERAVDAGLMHCRAMAVMLEWVAEECALIGADAA